MNNDIDPILQYLLDFNKENPIEYYDRFLIPTGGLSEMLKQYNKFALKPELLQPEPKEVDDIQELYDLLD